MTQGSLKQYPAKQAGARTIIFASVLAAGLFAGGLTGASYLVAVYNGSYVAGEIVRLVGLFWISVAAAAALGMSFLVLPVVVMLKGRVRDVLMPAVMAAAGYFAAAVALRPAASAEMSPALFFLLGVPALIVWSVALGALVFILSMRAKSTGAWSVAAVALVSVLSSGGLACLITGRWGFAVLIAGPWILTAAGALALGPIESRRKSTLLAAGICMIFAGLLPGAGWFVSKRPLGPVERGFRPEAAKVARLAGKPNVIIITLDTLRADHTSLCGYKYKTTPVLEELSRDCRFFPYGESVDSWTLPAHASLFTGRYPREHGAHAVPEKTIAGIDGFVPCGVPLAPSQVTLASYLSMAGYNTGAVSANYSWLCRQYGLDQGFSYYFDLPRYLVFVRGGMPVFSYGLDKVDRMLGKNGKLLQSYHSARAVTGMAESWVRENSSTPFFLFLNYMDPHYPYSGEPPFDKVDGPGIGYDDLLRPAEWQGFINRFMRTGEGMTDKTYRMVSNHYDGEIAYMDHWVGELIKTLKAEGLYDETLIIIASDHGEFFGEHGLLNHGVGLYEGGLRIPILVKYPGGRHAGEVRNERVSIMDIFATVFDVLNMPAPETSAIPLGGPDRESLYAEDFENGMNVERFGERFRGDRTAVYDGGLKYIFSTTAPGELYDIAKDEAERDDLAGSMAEAAATMEASIAAWRESVGLFDGSSETAGTISPEEYEKLRALGYTGN